MTDPDSMFKSRDITLPTKVRIVKTTVFPWVGKIPWRKKWQPTPVFLPGESHRGACQATVHGVARVRHNLATKPWFSQ